MQFTVFLLFHGMVDRHMRDTKKTTSKAGRVHVHDRSDENTCMDTATFILDGNTCTDSIMQRLSFSKLTST